MKLVHLSDLHVSERSDEEYRNLRLIGAHIIEHHADAVVAITGDLTNSGTQGEFDVVAGLLGPLVTHCRLVLVCPGNHDVEWMGTFGDVDRRPFAEFRRGLTRASAGYPYVMQFDGIQITMIDTTAGARGITDLARGRVGRRQRLELADYLDQSDAHTRIVCGHHDLWADDPTTLLTDAADLRSVLAGPCDMYLGGHEHRWAIWRDVGGVEWIADAGKSTRTHRGRLWYRVFSIQPDKISFTTAQVLP